MILIRALAFLLHFTLVPVAVGRLITYRSQNHILKSPTVRYVTGFFGAQAIFFLLNFGFLWYQNKTMTTQLIVGGFHRLTITYSVIVAALVILWFVLDFKTFKKDLLSYRIRINTMLHEVKYNKLTIVYAIIFTILVVLQLYAAYRYEVNEWSYDDYDYVVTSVDDIDSDMITNVNFITGEAPYTSPKRAAQSWTTYISYLSVVSSFDVTTVCHTILPVILLLVAYGIYFYMAKFLFAKLEDRMIFMVILATAYIMGMFSHYSPTFRLLCTLWQGKAVLTALVVPFLICFLSRVFASELDNKVACVIALISLGACSLTVSTVFVMVMTVLGIFISMSIYHRKIYGVRYLLAGLFGPFVQSIVYICVALLLKRQWEPKFFINLWNGLIS